MLLPFLIVTLLVALLIVTLLVVGALCWSCWILLRETTDLLARKAARPRTAPAASVIQHKSRHIPTTRPQSQPATRHTSI